MIESRGQVFKCSPKSCDTSLLQPPADDKNAQKGSSSHSCSIPSKEKSVIMLSYHYRVRLERWNMWSRLTVCGPVGSHTTWAVKVIHLTAAAAAQHHRRAVVKSGLRSVQHFPEGQLAQKYEGGGVTGQGMKSKSRQMCKTGMHSSDPCPDPGQRACIWSNKIKTFNKCSSGNVFTALAAVSLKCFNRINFPS